MELGIYYWETVVILRDSLLLGSILYAMETICNWIENELRILEKKIDELYCRQVFGTEKGCPLAAFYVSKN